MVSLPENILFSIVRSISENTTAYDEIQENGDLEQTNEKQYENSDNIHVPLESMLMETVRDHMMCIVSHRIKENMTNMRISLLISLKRP